MTAQSFSMRAGTFLFLPTLSLVEYAKADGKFSSATCTYIQANDQCARLFCRKLFPSLSVEMIADACEVKNLPSGPDVIRRDLFFSEHY